MGEVNKEELRRLAEAAKIGDWFKAGDLLWFDGKTGESHGLNVEDDRFIAAANPATVLALLDELEEQRLEIEGLDALRERQSELLSQAAVALRGPEPALTRYSHADIPSGVKVVVEERDALRAEMDELRLSRARMFGELFRIGEEFPGLERRCSAARSRASSKGEHQDG